MKCAICEQECKYKYCNANCRILAKIKKSNETWMKRDLLQQRAKAVTNPNFHSGSTLFKDKYIFF